MWPVATVARMEVSLRNTATNSPLQTLEMIGGDTMEIKCPYCGSKKVGRNIGGTPKKEVECPDCKKKIDIK